MTKSGICQHTNKQILDNSNCYDSVEVLKLMKALNRLDYLEQKIIIDHNTDSTQKVDLVIVKADRDSLKLTLHDKEIFITSLKQSFSPVIPSLVTWRGFYMGIGVAYPFNDSIITQSTFFAGLKYDLTATFKFSVVDKFDISGQVGIPLRKEKIYLRANLEYRIF